MKKTKINVSTRRLTDGQLEDLALAIAAAMNGNPNFPEPGPVLANLNDGIKQFSEGLALAKSRDKVKVAIKNKLRVNLEQQLTHLSGYCTYIAKGDRAILSSTGFPLNAANNQPKTLGSPENFTVETGTNSGEVLVYINTLRNANAYLFLYSPSPVSNNAWFHATSSLPYYTIKGLVPGSMYSFKIGAIGTKGQVVYTDVITKMVI